MKILATGNSFNSGSWHIRAEQLARAAGATVIPRAQDVRGYDVCVAVKRHDPDLPRRCRDAGVRYVWDIVDPWPQPTGNTWDEQTAKAWLHQELLRARPDLVIAATHAMARDVQAYGFNAVCIPHHHRSACAPVEIREQVRTVVYDGALTQLGTWATALSDQCTARGWRLLAGHLTPEEYAQADIVVALREGAGYAPTHWKSGVKLANAQACGLPFVGSPEAGYRELCVPGVERFAKTTKELGAAFDVLTPRKERQRVAGWMRAAAGSLALDAVAAQYKRALSELLVCA